MVFSPALALHHTCSTPYIQKDTPLIAKPRSPGNKLLSSRYQFDGRTHIELNPVQQASKKAVEQKVNTGVYKFEQVDCPVCGQQHFHALGEKDRYGLYFPVKVCTNCGLIQTNPRMTPEAYNEFYNSEYRPLYEGRPEASPEAFQLQYQRGTRILAYLAQFWSKPAEESFVLEVGCGSGGVLQAFREQGFQVKGIDLGEEYLRFGRETYDLDLELGTLADLELDQTPDIVIYSHVMEHILDVQAEFAAIREVLDESGFLFIEVPGVKFIQYTYGGNLLRLLQNAHTYHFTLQSLTNLAQTNGFRRLTGDEYVRAIFVPAPDSVPSSEIVNEYPAILSFLESVEFEYLLVQGVTHLQQQRFAQAAIHFAELVDMQPELPYLYQLFATALDQLGRVEDASRIRHAVANLV